MIELIRQLFEMLAKAFQLKKPDEVRKAIDEDKRPTRQQRHRIKVYYRAWRFARRKAKIEKRAVKRGLDDELQEELNKVYKE